MDKNERRKTRNQVEITLIFRHERQTLRTAFHAYITDDSIITNSRSSPWNNAVKRSPQIKEYTLFLLLCSLND